MRSWYTACNVTSAVSGYTFTFGACVYVSLSLSLSRSVCACVRLYVRARMCECECRCGRQRGETCARLCRVACVSHSICGRVLRAGDRRKADVPVYSDSSYLLAKDTRPPACLLACGAIVGRVGILRGIPTRTRATSTLWRHRVGHAYRVAAFICRAERRR